MKGLNKKTYKTFLKMSYRRLSTDFRWACCNGELEEVLEFLNSEDLNEDQIQRAIHSYNNVAFRDSAKYGHVEIVKLLVERGNINIHLDNDSIFIKTKYRPVFDYLVSLCDLSELNILANRIFSLKRKPWKQKYEYVNLIIFNKVKIINEALENYLPDSLL